MSMGRKCTARCTEIKPPQVMTYQFCITYLVSEMPKEATVIGTRVDSQSSDDLSILNMVNGEETEVAGFKDWISWQMIPVSIEDAEAWGDKFEKLAKIKGQND
jgi:hypothetical protein